MSSEFDDPPESVLYRFHATLHAKPPDAVRGPPVDLNGCVLHPLQLSADQRANPFPISFEQAFDKLLQLPQLFIEGDGSFYWMTSNLKPVWFMEGNLYDRDDKLQYVEVKGMCPCEEFEQILSALGWPQTEIMFQLVQAAVFLDDADFRRWSGP